MKKKCKQGKAINNKKVLHFTGQTINKVKLKKETFIELHVVYIFRCCCYFCLFVFWFCLFVSLFLMPKIQINLNLTKWKIR